MPNLETYQLGLSRTLLWQHRILVQQIGMYSSILRNTSDALASLAKHVVVAMAILRCLRCRCGVSPQPPPLDHAAHPGHSLTLPSLNSAPPLPNTTIQYLPWSGRTTLETPNQLD